MAAALEDSYGISYYDKYRKQKRKYIPYIDMAIITFKPENQGKVIDQFAKDNIATVARITKVRGHFRYKGHEQDPNNPDKKKNPGGAIEAKDVSSDNEERLDLNYYYGFARVEVRDKDQFAGSMSELIKMDILRNWLYAYREVLGNDNGKYIT